MANNDPSELNILRRMRFLAKDTLLYGGAAALNKAFALITFPLLARYFSVEEYGLIDFFSVLTGLLTTIVVLGQDSAIARFYYENEDTETRRQIVTQSFVWQALMLVLLVPLFWLFGEKMVETFVHTDVPTILIKLLVLQIPFQVFLGNAQNILKWSFARSTYLILMIGSVAFTSILLIIGVVLLKINIVGIFVIYLLARLVFALLGVWYIRHWVCIPSSLSHWHNLLPFALPYGMIGLVGVFIASAERAIVVSLLGSIELGLYAAGTKLAMLIALPLNAFQVAWGPFSYSIYKGRNASVTYNWVLKVFVLIMGIAVITLTLVGNPLLILLGSSRYEAGTVVILPLALGLVIQATAWITGIGIGLSKRSYLTLYAYGIFLVVSMGTMIVLGRKFGLAGIAWGMFLGYTARGLAESFLAQRAYPLEWPFARVSFFLSAIIGLSIISQKAAMIESGFVFAMANLILIIVMVIAVRYLFNHAERRSIMSALHSYDISQWSHVTFLRKFGNTVAK